MQNGGALTSDRVVQASGMVSVQAKCTIAAALVLIETRAVSTHTTVEAVAAAILAGEINFDA